MEKRHAKTYSSHFDRGRHTRLKQRHHQCWSIHGRVEPASGANRPPAAERERFFVDLAG
jgi:hypothetical protein